MKFVNLVPFLSSNITHDCLKLIWHNGNSKGLRVATTSPRGKKSKPAIDSKTDDLSDLCV